MHFKFADQLLTQEYDTLILGVYESYDLPPATAAADASCQGAIKAYLSLQDFVPKTGAVTVLYHPTRIILVGLGKAEKLDGLAYQKILRAASVALIKKKIKKVACFLPELPVHGHGYYWKLRQAVEVLEHATYQLSGLKGKPSEKHENKTSDTPSLEETEIFFLQDIVSRETGALALAHGVAIATAVKHVRDLGNTPGNICTPEYMAETATKLCTKLPHTTVSILSEAEMTQMGMGAFMAVTKGSDNPAQLVIIQYKGGEKHEQPIALVGKGITFDTGGLSLKPGSSMMGMKYDMCGAATVLSAIHAAANLQLPINIVAIMACAENMPSGNATRPDDIVTTMSGKTVEIANTDAEGRLVLCDTLTYAQENFHPRAIIDVATLTGACIVALGRHASAVYSNQQSLADELLAAGEQSLDRVWQMPLWEEYQSQLESPFADVINIGGPDAGSITAACFLSRFVDETTPWAHLDVAGTAFVTGKDAHATGRPTSLLIEFLLTRAQAIPQA